MASIHDFSIVCCVKYTESLTCMWYTISDTFLGIDVHVAVLLCFQIAGWTLTPFVNIISIPPTMWTFVGGIHMMLISELLSLYLANLYLMILF